MIAAGDWLDAAAALPFADLDAILAPGALVVLAPHPDDESLGCGGLIAEALARGREVRVMVASDGTGSHPDSPSYPPRRLRALREAETRAAVAELGLEPDHVTFLGLPDRAVPTTGRAARAAAEGIVWVARECEAGTLAVTSPHDPHGDHLACATLARAVAAVLPLRVLAYPVWAWTLDRAAPLADGPPTGHRLDIAAHLAAKRAAVAAHRSQVSDLVADDPGGFRLGPEILALHERPFEVFTALPKVAG